MTCKYCLYGLTVKASVEAELQRSYKVGWLNGWLDMQIGFFIEGGG